MTEVKRAISLLSILLTSVFAATVVLNGTVVSITNNQMVVAMNGTTVTVKLPPRLAANTTGALQVGSNVTVIGNLTNKGIVMAREIVAGNATYAVMTVMAMRNGNRTALAPHLNGTTKMVMNQYEHRMRHEYRNNQTNTTAVTVEIQETTTTTNPWNAWPSPHPMAQSGHCCNQHPTTSGGGMSQRRGR